MAKCKNCRGNNAKKLSVIEKIGTETGTATTKGIGMSPGGIGVGLGKTSINKKSDIAKEASFSSTTELPTGGYWIPFGGMFAWMILAIVLELSDIIIFVGSLITLGAIFLYQAIQDDPEMDEWNEEYTRQKEEWQKTWMCLDCGHKWVGKR